jgi:hypothetical protein
MPVEITAVEERYQGWSRIMVVTIRMPDGRQIKREIEEHGVAACVLPYDAARQTALLVRQPRAPVLYAAKQSETIEAIAGMIEEGDPALCARREAEEEALDRTHDPLSRVLRWEPRVQIHWGFAG